jgi:CRISPR/Cas system CSM-associated protein Csm3 (group 7 of RAMP superfamily)
MGRYAFVPFADKDRMVRRVARPNARHDRKVPGMWFGRLQVELVCEQPVHVGSGFKTAVEGKVLRRTARAGNALLVPGSSFKGVLRARFEAITRSCAGDLPSERDKVISQSRPEVKRGRFTHEVKRMAVFDDACGRGDLVCPACALFGFQTDNGTLRGRISVTDLVTADGVAPVTESMPSQFGPRIHHLGDFRIDDDGREPVFEVGPLHGRKFYIGPSPTTDAVSYERVEAIPRGVSLRGEIRILNLDDAEMGALVAALGVAPASWIKLGCGKGHGFGRVRVGRVVHMFSDERRGTRAAVPETWTRAFEASVDRWEAGMRRLQEIHQEAC